MSVSTFMLNVLPTANPNLYVPLGPNFSNSAVVSKSSSLNHNQQHQNFIQLKNPVQVNEVQSKNKKFKFSPEEDAMLRELVEKHGTNKWAFIAKLLNDRTARQCRDRWNHYLSHDTKEPVWTQEEDTLLMKLYNEIGSKWTLIAKSFEHRNSVSVRNRACRLIRRLKNPKRKERRSTNDEQIKEEDQSSSSSYSDKEEKSAEEIHVFECANDDGSASSSGPRVLLPSCKTLPFPVQLDGFFPGQMNSLLSLGLVF